MAGLRVRVRDVCACAAMAWCVASPLHAQPGATAAAQQERRIERAIREATVDPTYRVRIDPTLSLGERSVLDVGGSFSFSMLHLEDSTDNSRRLIQPEFQIYGRAVIDAAHTFFIRSRFQYRGYSAGDSFDGRGDAWEEPFLDRWWYEFDLGRAVAADQGVVSDNNFRFRIGRQFVNWGSGVALSEQLYAVTAEAKFGKINVTGLAGFTPSDESIIDFDVSRDEFDRNTERAFFGGEIRYTTVDQHEFYFSYLRMADWNSDSAPTANIALVYPLPVKFDYDANYFVWGAEGSFGDKLAYEGEFIYQSGRSTSDPLQSFDANGAPVAQTREDISAWAFRGQLTYFLGDERRTRFELESLVASGDGDRLGSTTDTVTGNKPGSDDLAFNSLGFVNTGLAFSPSFSNLMTFRVGASTFPFVGHELLQNLQVGVDVFLHSRLQGTAPIDEGIPGDDTRRFLGWETDFSLNWRLTSDFAITGRYGFFVPNDGLLGIPTPVSDTRHFLFVGATLSF